MSASIPQGIRDAVDAGVSLYGVDETEDQLRRRFREAIEDEQRRVVIALADLRRRYA